MKFFSKALIILMICIGKISFPQNIANLTLLKVIKDNLSPKSLNYNYYNKDIYCLNMIYHNNIVVFDSNYRVKKIISDSIESSFLEKNKKYYGYYKGGPVESVLTNNGKFLWVTNYYMTGKHFEKPGCDKCYGKNYDKSYVYKIDISNYKIVKAIKVGSVPKFITKSRDEKWLFVSNWTSGDIFIISTKSEEVVYTLEVGKHPRGIYYDSDRKLLYVAVMGENLIKIYNFSEIPQLICQIKTPLAPRHIVKDEINDILYVSCFSDDCVISIKNFKIINKKNVGKGPKTIAINSKYNLLYVTSYLSNEIYKLSLPSLEIVDKYPTNEKPVGLALKEDLGEIWVACYSGSIMVFKDEDLLNYKNTNIAKFLFSFNRENYNYLLRKFLVTESNLTSNNLPDKTNKKKEIKDTIVYENYRNKYYLIISSFSSLEKANEFILNNQYQYKNMKILKDHINKKYRISILASDDETYIKSKLQEIRKKYHDAWIYRTIEK